MQETQILLNRKQKQGISESDYQRIHYWLKSTFGKANKCENTDCKRISIKYSWALKPNKTYSLNKESFWQLCRTCHAKQDRTVEGNKRLSILYKGKKLPSSAYQWKRTKEWKKKISKILKGTKLSEEAKSHMRLDKACEKGHIRTKENTYYSPKSGERECRICRKARRRRYTLKYHK